jgi:hypothetical protein
VVELVVGHLQHVAAAESTESTGVLPWLVSNARNPVADVRMLAKADVGGDCGHNSPTMRSTGRRSRYGQPPGE